MKCRGPDPGPRGPNLEPQFRNLHFSKPPGRVPLWSPATDSRWLALSPWDGHTISQSGSVWSKSPFPLAPAPTQAGPGPRALSHLACARPRAPASQRWPRATSGTRFPSSVPSSGFFTRLAFLPSSALQNHVQNHVPRRGTTCPRAPAGACACVPVGGRRAAETCGICTRHVLALLFLSPSLSLPPPMPIPSPDVFFPSSFFHPPGCPGCCSKVIS